MTATMTPTVTTPAGPPAPAPYPSPALWSGDRATAEEGAADRTIDGALGGQVMIERAKSVVVVTRRVDEETAAQMLFDAAEQVGIPVRVAAHQIVTALHPQADDDPEELTQGTLWQALDAVRAVPLPRVTYPRDA